MGWNDVRWRAPEAAAAPISDSALAGISPANDQFYFVHSYHAQTPDRALVWGETEYGYAFPSALRRGNCFATQFHPEKSQAKGLQLYRNFLDGAARQPARPAR